jgi:HK97 family phage major capsid protein
MKKFMCVKCFNIFESEAVVPCPECKNAEVADASKDIELIKGLIDNNMKQLKKYQDEFKVHVDNGIAGAGIGGKKVIAKQAFNSKGRWIKCQIESVDEETEAWAVNLKQYIKDGAAEVKRSGVKITKDPHGMNIGVPGQGGYLTPPTTIMGVIVEGVQAQSIFLSEAFKIPAASPLVRVPRLVQEFDTSKSLDFFGGVTFSYLNDGGKKAATKPEIDYLQFTPHEIAALVPLTHALIDDSSINVVEWVTNLMIRAFAYLIDHDCIQGNGAGKCLGITNTPGILTQNRVTGSSVCLTDLVNMDIKLNDVFDPTSEWFMRAGIGKKLRLSTVGTLGLPQWMEGAGYQASVAQPFKPQEIGGRQPNYTYNTPALGCLGDVILGPPDQYWLAVRKELQVDESDHFYFDTNERALRFVARMDGKPAIPEAFVVLAATTGT